MYVTRYVDNKEYAQSSVMSYVNYLEKEGLIQEELAGSSRQLSAYLDKQNDKIRAEGREYFFNGTGKTYDCEDVTAAIDGNVKGLKKDEARYYTFAISPSPVEIAHLRRTAADMRQMLVESGEIIPEGFEDDLMRNYLKDYAVRCMDAYAQNFGHPNVTSNRDILWFGIVEKDRYWKSKDSEVRKNKAIDKKIAKLEQQLSKKGEDQHISGQIAALKKQYILESRVRLGGRDEIIRSMMPKAGDNWHIHITASRRDITNSYSLSPKANGKGSVKHQLNGQSVRVGFDREAYKIQCEKTFDTTFLHQRLQSESYEQAKQLRGQSAFAFEKQRLQDLAARKEENAEYARLRALGYSDYYDALMNAEHVDARQLGRMKGYLVQQIHKLKPQLDTETLMNYNVEELQQELSRISQDPELSLPRSVDGIAANVGDKVVQATGFEGFHPVGTVRKVLRRGIAMNKAVNLRREVFDKWFEIYSDTWYRENYMFDSIADRRSMECLLAQSEALEATIGDSVILDNAQVYLAAQERELAASFLEQNWPEWQSEGIRDYAVELFGPDAEAVKTVADFQTMAQERILPVEAQASITEAVKRSEPPQSFEAMRPQLQRLSAERAKDLSEKIEVYIEQNGQHVTELRGLLLDKSLGVHEREEAVLALASDNKTVLESLRDLRAGTLKVPEQQNSALYKILTDKALDVQAKEKALLKMLGNKKDQLKSLRDLRPGVLRLLERQNPARSANDLKALLKDIFENLEKVTAARQTEFAEVIDGFTQSQLPGYSIIVEKQSQLEQLLKEITPDPNKYTERLIDANNEIARLLTPQSEQLFEQHSRRLFGSDITIRNEGEFIAHVDAKYKGVEARQYKDSLKKVFARIDEKRREIIQEYVKTKIEPKELEKVLRQQNYINRHINKNFSAKAAKQKKEELQRRISSSCRRRVIPTPPYRVFDQAARARVVRQAMVYASKIKTLPISPQQIAIKAAIKLAHVLTNGY